VLSGVVMTDKKTFQFFFIPVKIMDRRIFHDFSVRCSGVHMSILDFHRCYSNPVLIVTRCGHP
jgi:hypothetical protein